VASKVRVDVDNPVYVYCCSASALVLTLAPVSLTALALRIGAPIVPLKLTLPSPEPKGDVSGTLDEAVSDPGRPSTSCTIIGEMVSQGVDPAMQKRIVTLELVPERIRVAWAEVAISRSPAERQTCATFIASPSAREAARPLCKSYTRGKRSFES
jgi:hypothetical protein